MILSTKLHIPYARSTLVQRPSLMQNLQKGMEAKLTLVMAPAGYGKTTALSEWVKQNNARNVWISLDKQDNDFVRFWSYVIAAIGKVDPDFGKSLGLFLSNLDSTSYDPLITALLNELNCLPNEVVLIFDDFHLIELSAIHASMARLLEHLPAHIHVFIASRSDLSLPTARLLARGELHRIFVQDLRFQLDEGIRFFQDCTDLLLSANEVSLLVNRTEGWISGLQLLGLSLKRSEDQAEFIQKFSGQHRDIANFLLEEVFLQQSEEIRTFLLKTSILSRMNNSLCQAVTSQTDCQDRLEMLERLNLFIIPLDEQRDWYRYHHLFSEFLQQYFRQKHPEQWARAHADAANWLKSHDSEEEAVEHFLAGQHYLDAVQLIEKILPGLMQLKRKLLHEWLTALPESCFAEKPIMDIFYIAVLISVGELTAAELRLRAILGKLDCDEWQPFTGTVYIYCANLAFIQKETWRASEYLEKFEEKMPEGSYLQILGGNTAHGTEYDNLLAFINDLHIADSFISRWIKTWEHKKNYPFLGYFLVSYSELMYEWNRLDEAELYAQRALERMDMQPFARILVHAAINGSRVRQANGQFDRAFELLDQVKLKINSPDYFVFMKKIETHKTYLSLMQGSSERAAEWLKACGLQHTDAIPLYRLSEYLCLARALAASGQFAEADYLLEQMNRLVSNEDRLRDKIKVTILHSMTLHRKGEEQDALLKLASALQLAEPGEYIRSFVDEGEEMGELLFRYLQMRQNSFIRESGSVSLLYVKKLLHIINANGKGRQSLPPLLTEQERNILRLIEQGLSNKEIADQIFVTSATVKTHIKNMYRKLDVNSRLQALKRGKELDML